MQHRAPPGNLSTFAKSSRLRGLQQDSDVVVSATLALDVFALRFQKDKLCEVQGDFYPHRVGDRYQSLACGPIVIIFVLQSQCKITTITVLLTL